MAINSDTKPLTPEELPANDQWQHPRVQPAQPTLPTRRTLKQSSGLPRRTNLAALNAEDGGAEPFPIP